MWEERVGKALGTDGGYCAVEGLVQVPWGL